MRIKSMNFADRIAALRDSTPDDCWMWEGGVGSHGYGVTCVGNLGRGRARLVHRLAYEMLIGPVPVDRQLDHLCRNPRCFNPKHLEAVTRRTNILRGVAPSAINARKTDCDRGHPLDGANLRIDVAGARQCRVCDQIRAANRRRRVKASRTASAAQHYSGDN